MKLYKNLKNFRHDSNFSTYLYRINSNTVNSWITRSKCDSSFLILYNSNNAEIFNIHINGETTSISEIAIEYIGNPSRIELVSKKLNCLLDLQLIRQ